MCAAFFLSLPAHSQFNLKVGYNIGFVDAPVYDELIRRHNTKAENYLVPFDMLKTLHGFELGFRQRWPEVSIEMGWKVRRNRFVADGEFSPGGATFSNVLVYRTHMFSVGLYGHWGRFSLGSTLDHNFLKTKSIFEEPEFESSMRDNAWSSLVSATYTVGGKGPVALGIRPYAQLYWTDYDFSGLGESLGVSTDGASEKPMVWGLSIVVFNGQQ
jgi:hypothetical protein